MDKRTFISELKQALSVLQEEELNDIISEYEQHIDMKQQNGLTEEEAIADFGSLSELAADILAAYHVRADYDREVGKRRKVFSKGQKEDVRQKAKQFGNGARERMAAGVRSLGSFLYGLLLFVGRLAGKPVGWAKAWWKRHQERDNIEEEDFLEEGFSEQEGQGPEEKQVMEKQIAEKQITKGQTTEGRRGKEVLEMQGRRACRRRRRSSAAFLGSCARIAGKIFRFTQKAILWGIRTAWNACCIVFALYCGCCGLLSLYMLGMLTVLLMQGYPLAGVTLGCLGLALCFFSATGLGITLLKKGKRAKEGYQEIEGGQHA